MNKRFCLILMIIFIVAVFTACSSLPPVPTLHPGKAIVESQCNVCHDIGRVTNHKDDLEGWTLTVDRMVLLGATLSDEQRDAAIDYLAKSYPEE